MLKIIINTQKHEEQTKIAIKIDRWIYAVTVPFFLVYLTNLLIHIFIYNCRCIFLYVSC